MGLRRYSIGELAERGGVTRRTVRYYIQKGVIPPPLGRGRGEHYGDEHLTALLRVKSLQEQGAALDEIRRHLAGGALILQAVDESGEGMTATVREACPSHRHAARPPAPVGAVLESAAGPDGGRPGRIWVRQVVVPGYELHSLGAERALTEGQLAALAQLIHRLKHEGENDES